MKIKEVQVEMREREFGESYLNPIKSIKYMANMVVSIVFIRSISIVKGGRSNVCNIKSDINNWICNFIYIMCKENKRGKIESRKFNSLAVRKSVININEHIFNRSRMDINTIRI